jgi:anti-anti-sigma factor
MAEVQTQYLKSSYEHGVLVLSFTVTHVEGQEMAAALRQEMMDAVDRFQAHLIVIDFQQTRFISSAAFWPLISLWRKVRDKGGRLILCGLSPLVGDVFYTTRLVSPDGSFAAPFGLEADVPAAIAKLTAPPADK